MHEADEWAIINGTGANPTAPADPGVLETEGLFFGGGLGRAWLAEAGCADDKTWTDVPEQGYKYLHSSFVDLIVGGVAGVIPAAWRADGAAASVSVAPLQPADAALAWWCVDGLRVGGRALAVLWDADGSRYGRGAGLSVLLDGTLSAHAATTQGPALTVRL